MFAVLLGACYYLASFPVFTLRFRYNLHNELHHPDLMPIPRKIWQVRLSSEPLILPFTEIVKEVKVEAPKEMVGGETLRKSQKGEVGPGGDSRYGFSPKERVTNKDRSQKQNSEDSQKYKSDTKVEPLAADLKGKPVTQYNIPDHISEKSHSNKPWYRLPTKRSPIPASVETDPRAIASRSVFSWASINTDYEHTLLSRFGADAFAKFFYANRPDLVQIFLDIQSASIKAEITKYLVLSGTGGVWADLDTVALQPADLMVPESMRSRAQAVVGIEYDKWNDGTLWPGMVRPVQVARWTLAAAPGHPLMQKMTERMLTSLAKLAIDRNSTVSDYSPTEDEMEAITGPGVWTDTVLAVLGEEVGDTVSIKSLSKLPSARLWGNVLVLPQDMFGGWQPWGKKVGNPQRAIVRRYWQGSKV